MVAGEGEEVGGELVGELWWRRFDLVVRCKLWEYDDWIELLFLCERWELSE